MSVPKGHLRTGSPALSKCASSETFPSVQTSSLIMMQWLPSWSQKGSSKDIPHQVLAEGSMSQWDLVCALRQNLEEDPLDHSWPTYTSLACLNLMTPTKGLAHRLNQSTQDTITSLTPSSWQPRPQYIFKASHLFLNFISKDV
jgi:hypothetical protein